MPIHHHMTETQLSLEYPNGRVHECRIDAELREGSVFEMYGRRWRADRVLPEERGRGDRRIRGESLLCIAIGTADHPWPSANPAHGCGSSLPTQPPQNARRFPVGSAKARQRRERQLQLRQSHNSRLEPDPPAPADRGSSRAVGPEFAEPDDVFDRDLRRG
jgi:hypothetical protein